MDFVDFLPLYVRTEDEIRADFDVDVNAGVLPTDPSYVDTRPGQFFHMCTQPFVNEAARIHDYVSTIPAVAFVQFAYGPYLDYHADGFNTEREQAVSASGEVIFSGAIGTLVPPGTEVSPTQTDPSLVPPVFVTANAAVICGALPTPTGAKLTGANTGGHLVNATYYYQVAAEDAAGETIATVEVSVAITGANKGVTKFEWNVAEVEGVPAPKYKVYRGTASGGEKESITITTNHLEDTGELVWTSEDKPKVVNTTGGKVGVQATAEEPGQIGNVGAGALTQILNPSPGMEGVTNPLPMLSGTDAENDEQLQKRLMLSYEGQGPGTQSDYRRWGLEYPGVGKVDVLPHWNGGGTVGVVITDINAHAVATSVVTGLQSLLDPVGGEGTGKAPIDHIVTVMTPLLTAVPITAVVAFKPGFSLDGTNNTTPRRANIEASLAEYFASLTTGDDVVKDHILAQFFRVEGVYKVTLTAPSADVIISSATTPPELAVLGVVTLS